MAASFVALRVTNAIRGKDTAYKWGAVGKAGMIMIRKAAIETQSFVDAKEIAAFKSTGLIAYMLVKIAKAVLK